MKPSLAKAENGTRNRKYKFSGHQTFAFRYGWLEKGVRGMLDKKDLFLRDDALVILGVGKNMVESIRHWCTVTQLIEEDTVTKKRSGAAHRVSSIGERLLGKDGWDPYLEDDASLWLIHWLLVSNPTICTTWQIAFSFFQRPDFTKREMVDYVAAFAEKQSVGVKASSLSRDIDCFVRTYTSANANTAKHAIAEEGFDCPLQELGLLQASPDGELYRFSIGAKSTLPSQVFGYALSGYFDAVHGTSNSMSVQECLYGLGSPGQAFKLDENTLIAHVEELDKITHHKVALDETAGLKQIFRREQMDALKLLESYYKREAHK